MFEFLLDYVSYENLLSLFAILGFCVFLNYLYENLQSPFAILKAVLQPYFQPKMSLELSEKFGNWAVITGSTDGIGKGYAKEFAKRGINIVLIARSKDKLIRVANELETEFSIKTKWIQADFSEGRKIYDHIEKELHGVPVGILVNNVGVMYDYPDEMCNVPKDVLWNTINVNVAACTMMTRMLTGQMKDRRKGAIVNISSSMEQYPLPNAATYSASKIFIRYLSQALHYELSPYDITVQLVSPMFVSTKMNNYSSFIMADGNPIVADVDSYVKWAVFTLGKTKETTGHWNHAIQVAIIKALPTRVRIFCAAIITHFIKQQYLKDQNAIVS